MDYVTVGLDFGTHQTKICLQIVPDEGAGQPSYEFFTFEDKFGHSHYFLPSLVKIKEDGTLVYGYDADNSIEEQLTPIEVEEEEIVKESEAKPSFSIGAITKKLFSKLLFGKQKPQTESVEEILQDSADPQIESLDPQPAVEYKEDKEVFRYFKQATFAGSSWNHTIDSTTVSIWYVSYILFLLEKRFGDSFFINMGVPADDSTYGAKKRKAVEILLSAIRLVEEVYQNDLDAFLKEQVSDLLEKTEVVTYSEKAQKDYNIMVFPEAYAGLATLVDQGKLSNGMCLYVDIGGGTTDFSFFTIPNNLQMKQKSYPQIYLYWSKPFGLNALAEKSGFDYADGDFAQKVDDQVIRQFEQMLRSCVDDLKNNLMRLHHRHTDVPLRSLEDALNNRVVVYNGGGSTYQFLTKQIKNFTDVKVVDSSLWKRITIKDKSLVGNLSPLLTTAFGLSLSKKESDVKLTRFDTLFQGLTRYKDPEEQSLYGERDNDDRTPRRGWTRR